jgi:hypothetical protein
MPDSNNRKGCAKMSRMSTLGIRMSGPGTILFGLNNPKRRVRNPNMGVRKRTRGVREPKRSGPEPQFWGPATPIAGFQNPNGGLRNRNGGVGKPECWGQEPQIYGSQTPVFGFPNPNGWFETSDERGTAPSERQASLNPSANHRSITSVTPAPCVRAVTILACFFTEGSALATATGQPQIWRKA